VDVDGGGELRVDVFLTPKRSFQNIDRKGVSVTAFEGWEKFALRNVNFVI